MLIPFVCFVFSGICDGKLYNNLGAIAWGTGYGKTVGWPIDHFNAVLNIFQSYFFMPNSLTKCLASSKGELPIS